MPVKEEESGKERKKGASLKLVRHKSRRKKKESVGGVVIALEKKNERGRKKSRANL